MKNMKENLSKKLKKKNGFTLIEMLIVVAIIAILVMVSIPLVTTSIDKAKKATDDANLRAAKAEAAIEYLGNDDKLTDTPYYDAKNGKFVAGTTVKGTDFEKYGQTSENKERVIKATVTETAGSDPNIEVTWVDISTVS